MLNRLCACLAVLLLSSASAQATTIWTGNNVHLDVSAPVAAGINLRSVTLTLVGDNGFKPNSFDGSSVGLTGITTSGNLLHQVWEFVPVTGAPTPTLALNQPANSANYPIDTHFLVSPPAILPGSPGPNENQPLADSDEAPNAGFGSFLAGKFALDSLTPSSWVFAQVVTEVGTQVNLLFKVASGVLSQDPQNPFDPETVNTSFTMVPEPTSLGIFAAGMLVLAMARIARRRSR